MAPYAADPARSRGRRHGAPGDAGGGLRDAFQRDRDRVIHSLAFRRLRHKTQVFVAPAGDHSRVRLTHSLEVAQIARTVARALGLNEDLTEAIALAHDIGHPPFGHAGEAALRAAFAHAGGFDHNGHTLRVLTRLERAYPRHDGLDLTWETLEGLAKHNGPVAAPGWALAAADAEFPLDLATWPSLEAQVAALADDIAYNNHDIDDGLRAGLLTLDQLAEAPLVGDTLDQLAEAPLVGDTLARVRAAWRGLDPALTGRELVREQIGDMVTDLVVETRARLTAAAPGSVDEVRAARRALVGFSPAMAEGERALKRFMYANLYHHPRQRAAAARANEVIGRLAAAYLADPTRLPADWLARLPVEEPWRSRHVADFIAGMTDMFALETSKTVTRPS